jgi:hypothetical protein
MEIDMGYVHLDDRAMPAVLAAREAGEVIDHLTAAMIVDAFTHGWATCWFAETGNFAVATECLPSTCEGEVYGGKDRSRRGDGPGAVVVDGRPRRPVGRQGPRPAAARGDAPLHGVALAGR